MLICFDLAVAEFPGQELTSPLTRFLHPFIASHSECVLFGKLCANIRIELGLLPGHVEISVVGGREILF